jgi:hypothetical protein
MLYEAKVMAAWLAWGGGDTRGPFMGRTAKGKGEKVVLSRHKASRARHKGETTESQF